MGSSFTGAVRQTCSTNPSFTLRAGSGVKTVYFKVQDGSGTESAAARATIRMRAGAECLRQAP
jgi:hypothetical protein